MAARCIAKSGFHIYILINTEEFIGSAQNAHPPESMADSACSPNHALMHTLIL